MPETFSTRLRDFNNDWYQPGGSAIKRSVWFLVNAFVFNTRFAFPSKLKNLILNFFGARIGKGVVIKPRVNIKYPWNLKIGDYSWIGENVWLDSLAGIEIGANVCISQGALLLCGNHNYKSETFDLVVKSIRLEDGVWIGANATVCPGITCFSHSVLTVGSVATSNLSAFSVYQGNPAVKIKDRI